MYEINYEHIYLQKMQTSRQKDSLTVGLCTL